MASSIEKLDCKSIIRMKYDANLLETYRVVLETDYSSKFSKNLNILVIKQVWS